MSLPLRTAWLAVFASAVLATACGGGGSENAAVPSSTLSIPHPVDPATAGRISGRVVFEGVAPAPVPVRMDSDPNCVPLGTGAVDETVLVGPDAGLANVFVYVKDGLGNLVFPIPSTPGPDGTPVAVPVVLDQKGCRYTPRVLGVQIGQPLEIASSDPTLHNVHAMAESNRQFNMGYPTQGIRHTHTFSTSEVMIPFKCDVHGWMRAYIGVLEHPFFSVSTADGAFALDGLPPGTYTIEAWHESLGTQAQTVTITPQESKTIAFSFGARA